MRIVCELLAVREGECLGLLMTCRYDKAKVCVL